MKLDKMYGMNVAIIEDGEKESTSDGGIIMPTTVQRGSLRTGTVLKSGKGAEINGKWVDNEVKENEHVIFDLKYASEFRIGNQKVHLMHAKDVLGKIEVAEGVNEG
jgi:co-chaperonin GroES (HSP10)